MRYGLIVAFATAALSAALGRPAAPVVETNAVSVKIVYPDLPSASFVLDNWADELAGKAKDGIHIRNGHALIVVRVTPITGEYPALTKLRAKFKAVELLRRHYPRLPTDFSASCRILATRNSDTTAQCVVVVSFDVNDIYLATRSVQDSSMAD